MVCAQAGCVRCLNRLIGRHKGLVHSVLQRVYRYGVPYDDLVQEGRAAMWRAVEGFDPKRGYAFSAYASVVIQRRLYAYAARTTCPVGHLPATLYPGQNAVSAS